MFYRSEVKNVLTQVAERLFDMESDKVNTGNLALAQDAQDALVNLTAGDVSYGYYNMTILGLGNSQKQAENSLELLAGRMRSNGYTVIRERQGLRSALLTTLPGSSQATLRWKMASTANIADLAPIRTISRGEPTNGLFSRVYGFSVPSLCRFLTPYGITYDFNFHESDLGHCAVVGGAGAGKTSLLSLLISQFQKYTPSQTYIFDKDYSLMMLTVLLGGKHVDMSPKGNAPKMNPVRVMMINGDDIRLRQWIETLIGAMGQTVSPGESSTINSAIQGLRRTHQSSWRLSGIYALIKGEDHVLAEKLAPYVDRTNEDDDLNSGPFARYFDNADDNFELTRIVGMECSSILESPQLASPFMDYAFYTIERSLDGVTPTLIYIEEAWYMMKNPVFLNKLEDWLRTFRKKKANIVFATQSLDEIAGLPNVGAFMTNIPTQIFLPSVRSSVREQAQLFKTLFGTTDAQIELLAMAIPKRDYLLVKPSGTRLVMANMPPIVIAINEATTQSHMRVKLSEYQQLGVPNWEMRFINEILGVSS
jgi:type IV secretion system protein VirB4